MVEQPDVLEYTHSSKQVFLKVEADPPTLPLDHLEDLRRACQLQFLSARYEIIAERPQSYLDGFGCDLKTIVSNLLGAQLRWMQGIGKESEAGAPDLRPAVIPSEDDNLERSHCNT